MFVAVNFMKSYASSPVTFLKASKFVNKIGADLFISWTQLGECYHMN